jgi:hypothetical protein
MKELYVHTSSNKLINVSKKLINECITAREIRRDHY